MKLQHAASAAALVIALAAAPVRAEEPGASKEANIGVITGSIIGALVGGPPGLIAGAALGGFTGDAVGEARKVTPLTDRVDALAAERNALVSERENLSAEVDVLRESLERERAALARTRDAATVADGLQFAIPFRTGSAEPPGEALGGLDALAMLMEAAPDLVLQLDGYADPRGDETYNAGLSLERAQAVQDYLVASGVDRDRIRLAGHGELMPGEHNDPEAWAMQRRVNILLQLAEDRLAATP